MRNKVNQPFFIIRMWTSILTPEPGFEPGSKAPQALRISKLPHSDFLTVGKSLTSYQLFLSTVNLAMKKMGKVN